MISTKSETSMIYLNKVLEKNKDNPVFYCQYAYARASSVINKANDIGINLDSFDKYNQVTINLTKDENEIILKLLSYPYILQQASNYQRTSQINEFCWRCFNFISFFWNKGKENESLRFIDNQDIIKTQSKLLWLH